MDYGAASVGLAISDESRQVSFGRGVLDRKKGFDDVGGKIGELCVTEKISLVVIGLPLDEEGGETEQTKRVRNFAKKLEPYLRGIPVTFFDESFTSFEANSMLAAMRIKSSQRKPLEDELAAMLILERFLGSQTGETASGQL